MDTHKYLWGTFTITSAVCPKCQGTEYYRGAGANLKIICKKCDIRMMIKGKHKNGGIQWVLLPFSALIGLLILGSIILTFDL